MDFSAVDIIERKRAALKSSLTMFAKYEKDVGLALTQKDTDKV